MTEKPSQCLVSAEDYAVHFKGEAVPARAYVQLPEKYTGPERRENKHDRRFYAGQGGRRRWDRKS